MTTATNNKTAAELFAGIFGPDAEMPPQSRLCDVCRCGCDDSGICRSCEGRKAYQAELRAEIAELDAYLAKNRPALKDLVARRIAADIVWKRGILAESETGVRYEPDFETLSHHTPEV